MKQYLDIYKNHKKDLIEQLEKQANPVFTKYDQTRNKAIKWLEKNQIAEKVEQGCKSH